MDETNADEGLEKALRQPKAIEVDGQRVENHSLADMIAADRYLASKNTLGGRKCPLRVTKMASGGGIR